MEGGLELLYIVGSTDHGPSGPGAYRVVGLKPMVLTMAPFSGLEFCAFPVGENTVVLNVECGELNVRRRCSQGFKASRKHMLPRIYTTHLVLTAHLMRMLTPYAYK